MTESTISSTWSPRSRKYSATAIAVRGARRRIIGLSSPVETTAIAEWRLSASASSRNSRTSRPRSPTSAITTVSKSGARASIASIVDLPTPDPAKTPMRCPAHRGVKKSTTRMPDLIGLRSRVRLSAGGGSPSIGMTRSPSGSGPAPSIGWPSASIARPFHAGQGASDSASAR